MDALMDTLDGFGEKVVAWAIVGSEVPQKAFTSEWVGADFSFAACVVACYLGFVAVGSLVMSSSGMGPIKPVAIKQLYNLTQVGLCGYMFVYAGYLAFANGWSVMPCIPFNAKEETPMSRLLWLFYVSKILDYADTVFIILSKNWKQLSFLHVYHHTTIYLFYWLNLRVGFDGDIYITIVLNGFIHTVMYLYYFLSVYNKKIWWKKYITMGQLTQFALMVAQAFYLLFSGCTLFPPRVTVAYAIYIGTLMILFGNFFIQSYNKPKGKKA